LKFREKHYISLHFITFSTSKPLWLLKNAGWACGDLIGHYIFAATITFPRFWVKNSGFARPAS
jgi:hypothetical protein